MLFLRLNINQQINIKQNQLTLEQFKTKGHLEKTSNVNRKQDVQQKPHEN